MGHYINDKGYLCYIRSGIGFSDTHGGREEIHRREQEELVNEIVDRKLEIAMEIIEKSVAEMIEEYGARVWKDLISSLKGALNEDIIAELNIGFNNGYELFSSKKAKEYFRKNIYDALEKELESISDKRIRWGKS